LYLINKLRFIILFVVLVFFSTTTLTSASISNKFYYAKKNYAASIVHNNKFKEKKHLKEIIKYGKSLNKNVYTYQKELNKLNSSSTFSAPTYKKKIVKKKSTKKKVIKKVRKRIISKAKAVSSKYSISSVYTKDNSIVINFSHKVSKKYLTFFENRSKNKYYDIFDIVGNFKDASPTVLKLVGAKRIKISQYKSKILRISILNNFNTKTIYAFNNKKLIIKILGNKKVSEVVKIKNNKVKTSVKPLIIKRDSIKFNKTVVIDAGHGGKDSGAVGPHRIYEKNISLGIARILYKELKAKGFKVYLTRHKDKFVSLRERTKLANKKKADMFISIHANATIKSKASTAKGIETYFLSPARSERAKRVAAKENKGDVHSMSYASKDILLTLLNRSKITSSQKMAIDIQSHMLYKLRKSYNGIVDGGVREGPFWVLVGAQMPSVLIEVGYVSHPTESRRISSLTFQKRIAKGMADGVVSYFLKN
jgi:N-acetylmuramoyl-L-alanine amidase